MFKTEARMFIFSCSYEAKSDTEAVFCIQASTPWFTAWNQF